jgi:rubrerythrin
MLLLENTDIIYSSSYQRGCNNDDNNNNTISTNNNNNANLDNNKNNVKYSENHQKKHFLICESCFWCTTYLRNDTTSVSTCPICNNAKVEFLPIANDPVD